jgi:hypothetical protein
MSGAVIEWNCTRGPVDILQNWRHTFRFNGDRHWLDTGPNSCCGGEYNLFPFLVMTKMLAEPLLARGDCQLKFPCPKRVPMGGGNGRLLLLCLCALTKWTFFSQHKCDLINMSYGEPTLLPDYGRFVDLVNEVSN